MREGGGGEEGGGRTGCAEDEVEVFGLAVFCLDPSRSEPLDGARDEVDLTTSTNKLVYAWLYAGFLQLT